MSGRGTPGPGEAIESLVQAVTRDPTLADERPGVHYAWHDHAFVAAQNRAIDAEVTSGGALCNTISMPSGYGCSAPWGHAGDHVWPSSAPGEPERWLGWDSDRFHEPGCDDHDCRGCAT